MLFLPAYSIGVVAESSAWQVVGFVIIVLYIVKKSVEYFEYGEAWLIFPIILLCFSGAQVAFWRYLLSRLA